MSSEQKFEKLNIMFTEYKTIVPEEFKNRKNWEKEDIRQLKSFIPGTIIQLNVKVGQKVEKGEILLLLEAMKMRNKVIAPVSGTIKEISVKVGESIPNRHNILYIEE